MLSLADVHVHFGKLHILQGVSLEVNPGEAVALLGRNGVGKTTTLRAIMGLAPRGRGKIEFDGHDLARCEAHEVPRKGIVMCRRGGEFFRTFRSMKTSASACPGNRMPNARNTYFHVFRA